MASDAPGLASSDIERLTRRVRRLVAATVAYNTIEAAVALMAGGLASSSALVGFGADSLIEVISAGAVAWQFAARTTERRDRREHVALQVTAVSFFALALLVGADALRSLLGASRAHPSTAGIVLAGLSLAVMPCLSISQRRAGRQLGSASAVADSKQEMLCTYLSAVLVVGLAVNATLGWSWADPVAGLVIAVVAVREGRNAWRGNGCCSAPGLTVVVAAEATAKHCEESCAQGCLCC